MTAFLIFNLRDVFRVIDNSAQVWEDRSYWRKAERLREKWRWTVRAADRLEALVRADLWPEVPSELLALVPRFGGVTVVNVTRNADWWCGAKRALLAQDPQKGAMTDHAKLGRATC